MVRGEPNAVGSKLDELQARNQGVTVWIGVRAMCPSVGITVLPDWRTATAITRYDKISELKWMCAFIAGSNVRGNSSLLLPAPVQLIAIAGNGMYRYESRARKRRTFSQPVSAMLCVSNCFVSLETKSDETESCKLWYIENVHIGNVDLQSNTQFMRKIPAGAEASNILVGEVDFLDKPLSAFIRLTHAGMMGDLTEVPVPTRFIFVLLGPTVKKLSNYSLHC